MMERTEWENLQPLLQLYPNGNIKFLTRRDHLKIIIVILQEWQNHPWLLEQNVPPWFSFDEYEGRVRIVITRDPLFNWTQVRRDCNDFWFALELLMHCCPHDWNHYYRLTFQDSRHIIQFLDIQPYSQRLQQEFLSFKIILIPDLRRIVGQYLHFIL